MGYPGDCPGGYRFSGRELRCLRGGRPVFEGLDFGLAPGGVLILNGANGSGKSSLLRLMAGLIPAAAGEMLWDGAAVAENPAAHAARLHYVGHADAARPVMTARELLCFWRDMHGGGGAEAETALARFGLLHRADFPARYLSSGQKRRLALARLLVSEAPLWLLDEPTVGLDADGVAALETVIAEHCARGGMVVAATHIRFAAGAGMAGLDLSAFVPDAARIVAEDALSGLAA